MARLILLLLLFAALALALAAGIVVWRTLAAPSRATLPNTMPTTTEDRMPRSIQNVAFVVLLLLLAGLAAGWLGPA